MAENSRPQFFNYPEPKETKVPWKEPPAGANPVVRGLPLHYGAYIVESLTTVSNFLYNNAGFTSVRKVKELGGVECRYDPTVVPILNSVEAPAPNYTDGATLRTPKEGKNTRFWSVKDYHEAYLSKTLTPSEVIAALLPLVRRDVPKRTNHSTAFLQSREDLITAAAEASTKRYAEGKQLGVLDGIPIAIKDEVDLKGYKKCLGSKKDLTLKTDETSWCVLKWQEEGAIVIGKTNMHEFGLDTTNNNPIYGTPRNPYNSKYYTGGSSGGTAYAVAAGLVPFGLGLDGGGSIRIPSSFCGLYGLKTSHGRVSDRPSPDMANTNTVVGPMAADMSSLEVSYRVMVKPDNSHPTSPLFPVARPFSGSRRKVIGIFKPWFDRADAPVRDQCYAAVDYMTSKLGYEKVDIQIPLIAEGQTAHALTILNEAVNGIGPTDGITAPNKVLLAVGGRASATDFLKSAQMRQLLMSHLAFLYQKYPGLVIVTPTTTIAGWPIKKESDLKYGCSDGDMSVRSMEYVWLANFTGCPCIQFPVGYSKCAKGYGTDDIPIGMMGMGEWGSDDTLIEFGYDGETYLHDGYVGGRKMPPNWVNVLAVAKQSKGENGVSSST